MPPEPSRPTTLYPESDTLIQIDHVTFGYDASRTILNDVSLDFARGKVTAIMGGSGCGKTTLLRLIGGVYKSTAARYASRAKPSMRATPSSCSGCAGAWACCSSSAACSPI